jgi:hypothetical protein
MKCDGWLGEYYKQDFWFIYLISSIPLRCVACREQLMVESLAGKGIDGECLKPWQCAQIRKLTTCSISRKERASP